MSASGRFHPCTVTHQPDAYVLQGRLTLGIRQVSHADRHITAVATFLPTERVLAGLMTAGFLPVEARQASARRGSPLHARHVVRLRPRFDTVQLKDSVAEVSVTGGTTP
jgi:hypothetical protein